MAKKKRNYGTEIDSITEFCGVLTQRLVSTTDLLKTNAEIFKLSMEVISTRLDAIEDRLERLEEQMNGTVTRGND